MCMTLVAESDENAIISGVIMVQNVAIAAQVRPAIRLVML